MKLNDPLNMIHFFLLLISCKNTPPKPIKKCQLQNNLKESYNQPKNEPALISQPTNPFKMLSTVVFFPGTFLIGSVSLIASRCGQMTGATAAHGPLNVIDICNERDRPLGY